MRKFFSRIHLWLSIPFGLILSVVCLTGALLVFEDDITQLTTPPPAAVAPTELHTPALATSGPTQGAVATAAPQQVKKQRLPFFVEVRKIHRWLLNPPSSKEGSSVGRVVVGLSSMAMSIILISGLIIWIPRSLKALRNRMTITASKGRLRLWHDAHTALGFYALIFLLLSALIGPTWSFTWYRDFCVNLFGGDPAVRRVFLELHTGSWGGYTSKILQFAAVLIGAILPLTGYYMWWRRTHPKRKS